MCPSFYFKELLTKKDLLSVDCSLATQIVFTVKAFQLVVFFAITI